MIPTVSVKIAFGSNPLDDIDWGEATDVSDYVTTFDVHRGRQHALDRFSAGTATIELDNRSRRFDPTNTGSPYYPDVVPMTPIQITADHDGERAVFTGFVERWPQDSTQVGYASSQVSCVDAFKFFSLASLQLDSSPYVDRSMKTDAAIDWLLDHLSWQSGLRDLDAGIFTVMLRAETTSVPLSIMQDIAAAEGGGLFITAAGAVRFIGQNSLFSSPYTTSQALFGDGAPDEPELPYKAALPLYDDEHLWNEVVVTPTGMQLPTNQAASDPLPEDETKAKVDDSTSQARYFTRQLALSVPLVSLQDANSLAYAYLQEYKDPRLYIGTLEHEWSGNDDVMDQLLDRELLDRITVTRRPMGGGAPMTGDYLIEQIRHHWDGTGVWETVWDLAPVPGGSALDPDTAVASPATLSFREVLYMSERQDLPTVELPDIEGLEYDYDADDVTGGEGAPADGTRLPQWLDAANGRALSQDDGSVAPVWRASAVNGHAAVYFDAGRGDFMDLDTQVDIPDVTLFAVVRPVSGSGFGALFSNSGTGGQENVILGLASGGSTYTEKIIKRADGTSTTDATGRQATSTATFGTWRIITITCTSSPGSTITIRRNGTGVSNTSLSPTVEAGGGMVPGGELSVWVARVLCYNSILSSGDINGVEAALKSRYGIA